MGMGNKGQGLLREDWAGLGGRVVAGQPAHCTLCTCHCPQECVKSLGKGEEALFLPGFPGVVWPATD